MTTADTTMSSATPLRLAPAFRDYVWGGTRLGRLFPGVYPAARCAEAWVISDRAEGMCRLSDGAQTGTALSTIVARQGARLLGTRVPGPSLPLLVKVLDAAATLSIQVHPDDRKAHAHGGEAKSEAWHILHAAPGAKLWCGLQPGVGPDDLRAAVRDQRLPDMMRTMSVSAGDTVFCPGGLVHAIGEGIVLLEVQQNSNTTYRLFDWGRREADGTPRTLHIEEALKVIDWQAAPRIVTAQEMEAQLTPDRWTELIRTPYFHFEVATVGGAIEGENDGGAFQVLFARRGVVRVDGPGFRMPLREGAALLLPAALARYTVCAEGDPAQIVRIQP
jgi:mannose-6-phosphate isomerase